MPNKNDNKQSFYIEKATASMIDEIIRVENSWPEQARASKEKMLARIEKFAQGFYVAFDKTSGQALATISTMPMCFTLGDISHFTSWDKVTNDGYLPENLDAKENNALYIVSGVIDKNYRGGDIFEKMVLNVVDVAKELGMEYVLAGAVIPGFKHYCEKHGDIPAKEYCLKTRASGPLDPLLNMYSKIDFHVPNASHVLPEYFPDDPSKNYAALVMHKIL